MAGTTTSDLNGLFKQAYADDIVNLIPEVAIVTRAVAFQGRDKMLGDAYNQPVVVRAEQGFTYAAPGSGAFNMNPAITMQTRNAVVTGYQILERAGLDYESVFKAQSVNAFRDAVDLSMENSMESFGKRLELSLIYGQNATGLMLSATVTAGTSTTCTLNSAAGQWAAGIWAGSEGAQLDAFSGSTLLNTAGPVTVVSVNNSTKSVTISAAAADITAIEAATAGTVFVRFYGSATNEMVGLDTILTNATGTLFNISASAYALWAANQYDASGGTGTPTQLTFAMLQKAVALAVDRGLTEDVDVLVNPATWVNLLTQQAALRMYDQSFSEAKVVNGSKVIEFFSQNGKLRIHAHIYMKEGISLVLPFDRAVRIGSTDVTFNIPGTDDGKIFQQQANNAGFEYRVYTQQSVLVETPAKCVKIYNLVN